MTIDMAVPEAHAACRWARVIVPVIDTPFDVRTVAQWSRVLAMSPSVLKTWCLIAGVSPRRSLVFARLLRAVASGAVKGHRPEDLLDEVDLRTLQGLLRTAGLAGGPLPGNVEAFLSQQTLVRDPDSLDALRQQMTERPARKQ